MRDCVQVMLFDRSDPDAIVAVDPRRPAGERRITALQELREHPGGFPRTDIVLVNIWNASGNCERQLCAYAGEDGEPYGPAIPYLSKEHLAEAREINARQIAIAALHPEFRVYVRGTRKRTAA